jgi:hypothetical protein
MKDSVAVTLGYGEGTCPSLPERKGKDNTRNTRMPAAVAVNIVPAGIRFLQVKQDSVTYQRIC